MSVSGIQVKTPLCRTITQKQTTGIINLIMTKYHTKNIFQKFREDMRYGNAVVVNGQETINTNKQITSNGDCLKNQSQFYFEIERK